MTTRKRTRSASRTAVAVQELVTAALTDMKATHINVLDVRKVTDVVDTMIFASGTSDRHVRSIADRVIEKVKAAGMRPFGVEGKRDGEWVLVDLHDVVLHVMLPRVREFYGLERLWEMPPPAAATTAPRRPARPSTHR
ncbi:MAG TPA: ribosome silencing factor [Steroidobacteraceae bacterium]|nr:ribosome silencing factor [Steroidobacteraceae bacterium]